MRSLPFHYGCHRRCLLHDVDRVCLYGVAIHYCAHAVIFCRRRPGAGLVLLIGSLSKRGLTPVKLALAGSAVTALLSSISSAIAIRFNVAKDISFWYAGGVSGVQWVNVKLLIPVAIVGLLIALALSRSITVMSLGEEVATGLGQKREPSSSWARSLCCC